MFLYKMTKKHQKTNGYKAVTFLKSRKYTHFLPIGLSSPTKLSNVGWIDIKTKGFNTKSGGYFQILK